MDFKKLTFYFDAMMTPLLPYGTHFEAVINRVQFDRCRPSGFGKATAPAHTSVQAKLCLKYHNLSFFLALVHAKNL